MDHNGEHLPEDIREIAARLSAARETATPLELDGLRRRVHGSARRAGAMRPRGRLRRVLGMNFVAALLASGLMLTSGAAVVIASGSIGGGSYSKTWQNTSFYGHDSASYCEYYKKWSQSYSYNDHNSIIHVLVTWDCHRLHFHFTCSKPFEYKVGSGGWYDVKESSYDVDAPAGTPQLSLKLGNDTYTAPFSW